MQKGLNWDRKSQLSEILTQPLNPRAADHPFPRWNMVKKNVNSYLNRKLYSKQKFRRKKFFKTFLQMKYNFKE